VSPIAKLTRYNVVQTGRFLNPWIYWSKKTSVNVVQKYGEKLEQPEPDPLPLTGKRCFSSCVCLKFLSWRKFKHGYWKLHG
jgi:hypothetical protein